MSLTDGTMVQNTLQKQQKKTTYNHKCVVTAKRFRVDFLHKPHIIPSDIKHIRTNSSYYCIVVSTCSLVQSCTDDQTYCTFRLLVSHTQYFENQHHQLLQVLGGNCYSMREGNVMSML